MVRRGAYLLSLSDRLGAEFVAKSLDEKVPKKPGRKYDSYAEWYGQNPNSFRAWVSKERKNAMTVSPLGLRKHQVKLS